MKCLMIFMLPGREKTIIRVKRGRGADENDIVKRGRGVAEQTGTQFRRGHTAVAQVRVLVGDTKKSGGDRHAVRRRSWCGNKEIHIAILSDMTRREEDWGRSLRQSMVNNDNQSTTRPQKDFLKKSDLGLAPCQKLRKNSTSSAPGPSTVPSGSASGSRKQRSPSPLKKVVLNAAPKPKKVVNVAPKSSSAPGPSSVTVPSGSARWSTRKSPKKVVNKSMLSYHHENRERLPLEIVPASLLNNPKP